MPQIHHSLIKFKLFLQIATAMQGRPMTGNRGSAFGMQTPVPQVTFGMIKKSCLYKQSSKKLGFMGPFV